MNAMRRLIRLVEGPAPRRLLEAAGTHSFFRPKDGAEVMCEDGYRFEHADYILRDPARFGMTQAEVDAAISAPDGDDPYVTPDQYKMAKMIALAMRKGWVRVNYYKGGWNFHAGTRAQAVASLRHYAECDFIQEAILEWGPDPIHPLESISLYPEEKVKRFVRTGKTD